MKFDLAWVQVEDMDASIRFYVDLLGGSITFQSPDWTSLSLGGTQIGLHLAYSNHRPLGNLNQGWTLGVLVEDLITFRKKLIDNNVAVAEGFDETPGGVLFSFQDPDGNPIQARQVGTTLAGLALG